VALDIGGGDQPVNQEIVHQLCAILGGFHFDGAPYDRLIAYIPDRPGHYQVMRWNTFFAVANES
jgi:dTDP-D-glucose 4,6-dehydratase